MCIGNLNKTLKGLTEVSVNTLETKRVLQVSGHNNSSRIKTQANRVDRRNIKAIINYELNH
jgi:hypothetical protein